MQDDIQKKRKELKLILTIVFLSGMIIGGVGGIFFGAFLRMKITDDAFRQFTEKPPMKNRLLEHLSNELALSEDQKAKIAVYLEDIQKTKETVFRDNMKLIQEQIRKSFDAIEGVLNPEQLEKFKEFRKRMKDRFGNKKGYPTRRFRRHHYPQSDGQDTPQEDTGKPEAPPPAPAPPPPPQAPESKAD